jgi:hypothetical protein
MKPGTRLPQNIMARWNNGEGYASSRDYRLRAIVDRHDVSLSCGNALSALIDLLGATPLIAGEA